MKTPIVAGLAGFLTMATGCTPPGNQTHATLAAKTLPTRAGNVVTFDPASPQLEQIRVAPATAAVLPVDEIEMPGKVEAVPARLARLALPVPGRLRSVTVTLGDRVRAGQVLVTLETPDVSELQSAKRQAMADVKHREAALAKAEADTSRVRDLLANRAVAQKEVLAADTEQALAVAALEQARATHDDVARRLRLFGVNAEQSEALATLRSPIDGEVIEIAGVSGEYRSDTAAPVIAVADLSRLWVVAAAPESALARIQTGQRITVAVAAYPDDPFEGRVARVAAALDAETRSAKVIVELANPGGRLKPEMFARVRYVGPAQSVMTVPVGAIVQDERRTSVFVERTRGEFERRDVSLGPRHDDTIVVTRGLAAGDRVVVDGTMLLMGQ